MACWERFDYRKMEQEAGRECEALRRRLEARKRNPPKRQEEELRWKRENSVLYTMYLEQRGNRKLFSRRAGTRERL